MFRIFFCILIKKPYFFSVFMLLNCLPVNFYTCIPTYIENCQAYKKPENCFWFLNASYRICSNIMFSFMRKEAQHIILFGRLWEFFYGSENVFKNCWKWRKNRWNCSQIRNKFSTMYFRSSVTPRMKGIKYNFGI